MKQQINATVCVCVWSNKKKILRYILTNKSKSYLEHAEITRCPLETFWGNLWDPFGSFRAMSALYAAVQGTELAA